MTINYIISDFLNYDRLICDDAGPGYASNMGWVSIKLSEINLDADLIFVVDNRITADETELLSEIIQNSFNPFFLKIVDPFIEYLDHYYYRFLRRMSAQKNAFLFSVYEPIEITALISKQYAGRFIHLPFPYLQQKEINPVKRKNKIIIAGSINKTIYPYRTAIWREVTRSLSRLLFFHILKHPGYIEFEPDKTHQHSFINDRFVQYLSGYKYMLLCPSRCNIEFLKYNECAYAGCMPVGNAPSSYPAEISRLFLPLRARHLLKDTFYIIRFGNKPDYVKAIRGYLNKTRDPKVLNANLKAFIIENPVYTS